MPPHSQHTGTPCTCFCGTAGKKRVHRKRLLVIGTIRGAGGRTFLSESCSDGAAVCGAADLFSFGPPDAVRSGRCLSS